MTFRQFLPKRHFKNSFQIKNLFYKIFNILLHLEHHRVRMLMDNSSLLLPTDLNGSVRSASWPSIHAVVAVIESFSFEIAAFNIDLCCRSIIISILIFFSSNLNWIFMRSLVADSTARWLTNWLTACLVYSVATS